MPPLGTNLIFGYGFHRVFKPIKFVKICYVSYSMKVLYVIKFKFFVVLAMASMPAFRMAHLSHGKNVAARPVEPVVL